LGKQSGTVGHGPGRPLPGEQENAKKIIADENDWIIWRVKGKG
jgi:hypothetical protein